MDELLRPDIVAQALGISAKTLANWRSQGIGPAYVRPNGGRVSYRASDLERWLAGQTHDPAQPRPLEHTAPTPTTTED